MHNAILSGAPLSDDEKARLSQRVAQDGEVRVAEEIGIARATLGRQIAGFRAHKASTIATRLYLSRFG